MPVDENALRQALNERLDQNLTERMGDLRQEISRSDLPHSELVELAEKIACTAAAHSFLVEHNFLPAETMQYLLQFENPLALVAEHWPVAKDDLLDFSMTLDDVMEDRDGHPGHPRMRAAPTEKQPHSSEKPSLLASLREAKARAESQKRPDNQNIQQSGPEL